MKKIVITAIGSILSTALIPASVFAHVVVTPDQAGIGQELIFNVSVPNEKNVAITKVRLVVPVGVQDVVPTVNPGWTIDTEGSPDAISAIDWTGVIPVGQRGDFSFSAQVPAHSTQLDWKAYQTYADGTVVHWDQTPAGSDDATGNAGPYSVTTVVNDLTHQTTSKESGSSLPVFAILLSAFAIVISLLGIVAHRKS